MFLLASEQRAMAAGSCSGGDASLDSEEQAFLGLINTYRSQQGLVMLAISSGLNRSSAWLVNDMGTKGYFGHTDSLGRSPWTRMGDCGNPTYGGENLAAGTERSSAASAFELLKNSPSHNAVMLSPEFRLIGIARQNVAGSAYGWYWATDFGNGDAAVEGCAATPATRTDGGSRRSGGCRCASRCEAAGFSGFSAGPGVAGCCARRSRRAARTDRSAGAGARSSHTRSDGVGGRCAVGGGVARKRCVRIRRRVGALGKQPGDPRILGVQGLASRAAAWHT